MKCQNNTPSKFLLFIACVLSLASLGISNSPNSESFISYFADRSTAAIKKFTQKKPIFKKPTYKNWGISNSKSKSHISAIDAWKLEKGSRDIVVAVIDTGLDPFHKDLSDNVWFKKQQSRKKVFGWDFVKKGPNPIDKHGHGTHVAGIIGAISNPKAGVAGVAQKVSIMSVRYFSDANPGSVNLANTVNAINYAVENGARIINYSGGGPEFSEAEYIAIKKAQAKGVLFVSAAGNEHQNTDIVENYYYPSAYGLSNIISVAATDINDKLIGSSNWGKKKVDLAAPGENIYSTIPGGRYGYMTGTSQATAFVSGLAALMLAKNPKLTPEKIKKLILASVDRIPSLNGKIATGGRLNAYKTLLSMNSPGFEKPNKKPRKLDILAKRPLSMLDLLISP